MDAQNVKSLEINGSSSWGLKLGVMSLIENDLVRKVTKFIAKKDTIRLGLSIEMVLKYSSAEIEKKLRVKVVAVKKVKKTYGSNTNSFRIKVRTEHDEFREYFLKFGRDKYIDDELKGDACIQGKLNTPRVILSSQKKLFGYEWILYELIEGQLMSEVFSNSHDREQLNNLLKLEKRKESDLIHLYTYQTGLLTFSEYVKSRANKLFYKRFTGRRYKEYYRQGQNNIANLFNRRVILNGRTLPITIAEIITNLQGKYSNPCDLLKVESMLGHGDAHHGNIILNDIIWFIDNEYADVTTPLMEIAKPYYNDFLGDLFFHGDVALNKLFRIESYVDDGTSIDARVKISEDFQRYIAITKIKLELRATFVNKYAVDFISLNDYLFLCHILTKNPNDYSSKSQKLFLILAIVIQVFDPYNPESVCPFFK